MQEGRSALRAVVQGDVACRLADRRGDRAGACLPASPPTVRGRFTRRRDRCRHGRRSRSSSTSGSCRRSVRSARRGAGLSARADQHRRRHGAARGISVGIGVARARVRRCRRGRDDVAVTTVRAAARLTPVTNPAAQQSRPSRCGQRSAISDQPVQPCPRAACIRPSTSPTNCRARRSEPSAHRRAARRSRPRTIRSSRSARRAPGRRAMRGS